MRHFKEMVKTVRNKGLLVVDSHVNEEQYIKGPKEAVDLFFKRVESCKSFLFYPEKKIVLPMGPTRQMVMPENMLKAVLPFLVKIGQGLKSDTVPYSEIQKKLYEESLVSPVVDAPFAEFSIEEPDFVRRDVVGIDTYHRCLFFAEISPTNFDVYLYRQEQGRSEVILNPATFKEIVPYYLERLKVEKEAKVSTKQTHNISYKEKAKRVPCNYTLVSPKQMRSEAEKGIRGIIDWRSRWLVRGHWMGLYTTDAEGKKVIDETRIGKDRAGDYYVKGYTWVIDHEKGPEDKELIIKPRIVKHA